ncbi:hypothetical protein [Sphingobacterium haloxyli]|uniref:hypothetical protein n=1 Tax=Sphingobacterium haloxyli TaxID=2100533 RepID=UPI0013FDDDE9|nr:hypothetical protein [Sphingobacterium haloxyli]
MKTIKKMQYVAPTVEVLEIEMEEGIAGGSAAPGATPTVDGYGTGTGSSGWSDDGQF